MQSTNGTLQTFVSLLLIKTATRNLNIIPGNTMILCNIDGDAIPTVSLCTVGSDMFFCACVFLIGIRFLPMRVRRLYE